MTARTISFLATLLLPIIHARAEPDGLPPLTVVGEPTVEELQRAAIRHAELEPERVRSWERRLRLAPLAPTFKVQVGRGLTAIDTTTDASGNTRLTIGANENWQFQIGATWSLDRLVFNPEETRLAREAQRVASRRERLVTDVATIYYERRRIQLELAMSPPSDVRQATQRRLELDELTAVLDGITGGALRPAHPAPQPEPSREWIE